MDIDDDKERRRPVHMDVTDQPAVIHVAHDALDRIESMVHMRRVMHRQHDSGGDHDDQDDPGQRAEIPPVIQVLRRRILMQLVLHEGKDRKPVIDPFDDRVIESW